MKAIRVTNGYLALVDDEDFDRCSKFKWSAKVERRQDGTFRDAYACSNTPRAEGHTLVYLHRLVMGVTNTSIYVDHVDHCGMNCQKSNLRIATPSQNTQNSRIRTDSKSGRKGVSWNKVVGKWNAYIYSGGKRMHLGYFDNVNDAGAAYDRAAVHFNKQFASVNFPQHLVTRDEYTV